MFKKFIPLYLFISIYSLFAMKQVSVNYTDPTFVVEYTPYLAFAALMSFFYWLTILKKTTPLIFSGPKNSSKVFWIIFGSCSLAFAVTLLSAEKLNYRHLFTLVAAGIAVGINEEFLFRVAGYRHFIEMGASNKKSIFVSALLFSSFHLLNLSAGVGFLILFQLVNTFMMGCVLAYIYFLTKSVWYPVATHGILDLTLFANNQFGNELVKPYVAGIVFIVSLGSFIWFLKNQKSLEVQS